MAYSYYTMLCYFLLYSNQLHIYIYPLVLGFPSHLGHHRALSRAPVLSSRFSLVTYFIHSINSVHMSIPVSQFILPLPTQLSLLGVHMFVLYDYVSISTCRGVHLYQFSRLYLYALTYDMSFFKVFTHFVNHASSFIVPHSWYTYIQIYIHRYIFIIIYYQIDRKKYIFILILICISFITKVVGHIQNICLEELLKG